MPPVARVRPTPNWSPVWTTLSSWNCISSIFSLITGAPVSSVSVVMILFEAASITSPVEGYAYRPSIVNVIQPGSSRTLMLANCVGGMTVATPSVCLEKTTSAATKAKAGRSFRTNMTMADSPAATWIDRRCSDFRHRSRQSGLRGYL